MGVYHSSKSTSSHSREGQKASGDPNNKENASPNQGEQRQDLETKIELIQYHLN